VAECLATLNNLQGKAMDELGELLLAHAGSGNTSTVRDLIARGANPNYPDAEQGDRPLHRAAMEGRTETARALIELGADVNAADNFGWRPLHWAADGGHMDMIRLLIQKGAQANAADSDNQTAAHWADVNGHAEAATFLKRMESLKGPDSPRSR
jgi:ankyrin repeat protein